MRRLLVVLAVCALAHFNLYHGKHLALRLHQPLTSGMVLRAKDACPQAVPNSRIRCVTCKRYLTLWELRRAPL